MPNDVSPVNVNDVFQAWLKHLREITANPPSEPPLHLAQGKPPDFTVPGPVAVGAPSPIRAATQAGLTEQGFRPTSWKSRAPRVASDAWDLGELSAAARKAVSGG